MSATASIFQEFNLPNATTWFYFSLLLAVALFFKFSRLLSMRNLDVLALFLPVPGLLLLLESGGQIRWGFVWLLAASGALLVRCLLDLALVRRPALTPNLDKGGLAWLAGALFVSLVAVAAKEPDNPPPEEKNATPADRVQQEVEKQISQQRPGAPASLWAERALAVACHLAVAVGLVCVGWRHFQDLHAGAAAATFYLLLPYTFLLMPHTSANALSGRWHHVWPMALLVWAVVAYRKPTVAGLLLGLAGGFVYFPLLVLPVWLSFYWRRGACRFAGACALGVGLCLAWLTVMAWASGDLPGNFFAVFPMAARDWLPWLEPAARTHSFWTGLHWAYRIPIFGAYLALALTTAFWPRPKDLAHLLALSAALLIGTQFWYADQGGIHVLWYLPFLLLLTFRPNLSAAQPPPINRETDWLARIRRATAHLFRWALGLREPPVRVS